MDIDYDIYFSYTLFMGDFQKEVLFWKACIFCSLFEAVFFW